MIGEFCFSKKGGKDLRKLLWLFLVFVPTLSFALQISSLTANPVFLLKGDTVNLSISASPSSMIVKSSLALYDSSANATYVLYNAQISGNNYSWPYYVGDSSNYRAQAIFSTSAGTVYSNTATFTTNIPAASVQSTIVTIPFISNVMSSYSVNVKNIGSQTLYFTTESSPTGLSISPEEGQIFSGESTSISLSFTGFFLPGKNYTLDAILKSNDPRTNMSTYLLGRFLVGPDGLEITPVELSNTKVGVGSDITAYFSILYSDVTVSYVYAIWATPNNTYTFNLPLSGNNFSTNINTTMAGTYTFSKIIVGYTYNGQNLQMVLSPNINVSVYDVPNSMNLTLINGTQKVAAVISSSSTPTLYAFDNSVNTQIPVVKVGQTWTGTYTYANTPGQVTITSSFQGTQTVISKTFSRYMVQGNQNLYFSDGWITIPSSAFPNPALVAFYSENFNPSSYYTGYSTFNQISDSISLVSTITPASSFDYTLYFNTESVNGLLGNVKVYSENNGNWYLSSIIPNVTIQMANFYAKTGTYALGLNTQIEAGQIPSIDSFVAVPAKLIGNGNVQFFLTVDEDCYYQIYIYDLRGRIVGYQKGTALKINNNLVYTLNSAQLSNGLYTAVIGIGNSPNGFSQSKSIPFVVVK